MPDLYEPHDFVAPVVWPGDVCQARNAFGVCGLGRTADIHAAKPDPNVVPDARAYWDQVGHKIRCPVYGDEEMIETCTCGPDPSPAAPQPVDEHAALVKRLRDAWANCPHSVGFCETCTRAALVAGEWVVSEPGDGRMIGTVWRHTGTGDEWMGDKPPVETSPFPVSSPVDDVEALRVRLVNGLQRILESYPQVDSPAVAAGVIGDFDGFLMQVMPYSDDERYPPNYPHRFTGPGPAPQPAPEPRVTAEDVRRLLARYHDAKGHRCGVCVGVSPSWDGHDKNPPCEQGALEDLLAAISGADRG